MREFGRSVWRFGARERFLPTLGVILVLELLGSFVLSQYVDSFTSSYFMHIAEWGDHWRSVPFKFSFVDIDDRTFEEWSNAAEVTSRKQVKRLIERVSQDDPAAIVVDLDLSSPGSPTDDDCLKAYVRADAAAASKTSCEDTPVQYGHGKSHPAPLIFVRSLKRHFEDENENSEKQSESDNENVRRKYPWDLMPSLIDADAKGNDRLVFGAAGFLQSRDGIVRSWLLAEPACDRSPAASSLPVGGAAPREAAGTAAPGTLVGVASVELLLLPEKDKPASAALRDGTLVQPAVISAIVRNAFAGTCQSVATEHLEVALRGNTVWLSSGPVKDRIVYTIPPPPRTQLPSDSTREIERWSARELVPPPTPATPPVALSTEHRVSFVDRIVIIGGSNGASRDVYATPLGAMPGAVVLANATQSLAVHLQLRQLTRIVDFVSGVLLGILTWAILAWIGEEFKPIYHLLFYLVIALLSVVLLYLDIWYNFFGMFAALIMDAVGKSFMRAFKGLSHKIFGARQRAGDGRAAAHASPHRRDGREERDE